MVQVVNEVGVVGVVKVVKVVPVVGVVGVVAVFQNSLVVVSHCSDVAMVCMELPGQLKNIYKPNSNLYVPN